MQWQWIEITADGDESPSGVLEFDAINREPALELHVISGRPAGTLAFSMLEDGTLLRVAPVGDA